MARLNGRQKHSRDSLAELTRINKEILEKTGTGGGGGVPITGFSTESKQDDIITELQNLVNKVDFEIVETIGIDSNTLNPVTITTPPTSDSLGLGGGTAPSFTTVTANKSFEYEEVNRNYAVLVPITGGFPNTGTVNLFFRYSSVNPNGGSSGAIFYLQDSTGTTSLNIINSGAFAAPGNDSKIIQLTFDNTSTNYTSLRLFIQPNISGTYPARYEVDSLGSTAINYSSTDLITRVDTYENGVLTSTTYRDSSNNPYTLIGDFISDSNFATESTVEQSLVDISNKVSTASNQLIQIDEGIKTNSFLDDRFFGYEIDLSNSMSNPWLGGFPITINSFTVSNGYEDTTYSNTVTLNNNYELIDYLNTYQKGYTFSSDTDSGSPGDIIYVTKGIWEVGTKFRLELEEDVRGTLDYEGMVDFPATFYNLRNSTNVNDLGVLNELLLELYAIKKSVEPKLGSISFIEHLSNNNTPTDCSEFSIMFWGNGGTLNNVSVPDGYSTTFSNPNSKLINAIPFTVPTSPDVNNFQRVTISVVR